MEKWEDRKDFSFPHLCLVKRVEKWRDTNFFFFFLVWLKREMGGYKMEFV